ncbi:MAG: agmatinase [Bacteroidota bacterium]
MNASPIQLLGLPFDAKSSFLRGAAQAPDLIRQTLHNGSSNYLAENGIHILEDIDLKDIGNVIVQDYQQLFQALAGHMRPDVPTVSLGGDHSITYPIVKALHDKRGTFDLLLFDAHTDLYEEFEGDRYSHACPFARIMEDGLVSRLVQVGIRSMTKHQHQQAGRYGVEIIPMRELDRMDTLSFANPLYVSIDLDGFDPAFAPGVSHHEPGGLVPRDIINFLHQLDAQIIGADIVEYNPIRDHAGITAALAAKLLKELAGIIGMGNG